MQNETSDTEDDHAEGEVDAGGIGLGKDAVVKGFDEVAGKADNGSTDKHHNQDNTQRE